MANENQYKLQLRRYMGEPFGTREDAERYINTQVTRKGLAMGEPALFFYKNGASDDKVHLIVAIGRGEDEYGALEPILIDEYQIKELATKAESEAAESKEKVLSALNRILEIVKAVGLEDDDNRITNQIYYKPDPTDALIRNAANIAEAVDIISKYAQSSSEGKTLSVEDSSTIHHDLTVAATGTKLKSDAKISRHGETDELDFNDNILGSYDDGLYACVNIEYDEINKRIIFTKSGMKNGRFVDDAVVKEINLGEHTEYTPDNDGHDINVSVNNVDKKISADVKVSDDADNILIRKDGRLFVEGCARNIKYKNTNVGAKIDEIDEKIEHIQRDAVIDGVPTDTAITTVTKDENGCNHVRTDVRLSNDGSVIVSEGGVSVDLEMSVDTSTNKLIVRLGNNTKEYQLPGVDIIDSIKYDQANKNLIIRFKNGTEVTIPVADLMQGYNFVNTSDSPVVFNVTDAEDGSKNVSATLRLRSTDNLIGLENGNLYVSQSGVQSYTDNAVTAERNARESADSALSSRVSENETGIRAAESRIDTLRENLHNEINLVSQKVDNETSRSINKETELGGSISNLQTRMSSAEGAITRATAERTEIKASVQTLDAKIDAETARAIAAENALNVGVNSVQSAVDKLNGDETTSGSVREIVKHVSDDLGLRIDNETTRAMEKENSISSILTAEIANRHTADNEILASAKTYTDGLISAETARATAAEGANAADIANLKAKDVEIESELSDKIEKVEIKKNTASDLQYILYVDNVPVSEINIPKDQFLKSVTYDSETKTLHFIFITTEGQTESVIDISDLVSTYEAGNGIKRDGNVFSINIDRATQEYISVTENGLAIVGIDEALALKANSSDVYTKAESDAKYLTEHQDISNLATKDEVETIANNLNGTINRVGINEAAINTINGNEATEGSIKKAQKDAQTFATNAVAEEAAARISADDSIRTEVAEKASVESLNNEIARATNTENAITADLTAKYTEVKGEIAGVASDVTTLEGEVNNLKFTPQESDTVKLTMVAQSGGRELNATAKISNVEGNAIKYNGNGLYATVTLSYDKATNVLTFNDGNGAKNIPLSNASLVEDAYYDAARKAIILIIRKDEQTQEIVIPVASLVNDFDVINTDDDPIKLTKGATAEGKTTLMATVAISTESHNGIVNNNGTLYASNRASDLTAIALDGSEVTIQIALNGLYSNMTDINNQMSVLRTDMDTLRADMDDTIDTVDELKDKVTDVTVKVAEMKHQVDTNTENIARHDGAIINLNNQFIELSGQFGLLSREVQELSDKVDTTVETVQDHEERITALETRSGDIDGRLAIVEGKVSDIETTLADYKTRIEYIEDVIAHLIDFGSYSSNTTF